MPIGSRNDDSAHPPGVPGIPATLRLPAADPGQLAAGGARDWTPAPIIRRLSLRSQVGTVRGAPAPIAVLEGPPTGAYVIERMIANISAAQQLYVHIGAMPDDGMDNTTLVDYVDNLFVSPTAIYAIAADPMPLRLGPGEFLTLAWTALPGDVASCWANLQVRVLD